MPVKPALENILFLDIETVPLHASFGMLDEAEKKLWLHKAEHLRKKETDTPDDLYHRAGIYAEFGKIICISCGYFRNENLQRQFRIKSFYGDDEKGILMDFCDLLSGFFCQPAHLLCAHNGKEFDFPFLSRRIIINDLKLPVLLDLSGKKPWEINHLDTMDMWRFGDYKSFTPLNLLAHVFNIPSPKDDIDGSMVWRVYWEEKNLERIVTYCQKDVVTIAQIVLKFFGDKLLLPDEIILAAK